MKLVIFDFDGTIADSMWAWDNLGEDTLKEHNIPLFSDYRKVIRTMSVLNFSKYLTERYPVLGNAEELMDHWHEIMKVKYTTEIKLKPGIIELLETLKKRGYTLYLASATKYEVLMTAVKHFGLEKYFSFIIAETMVNLSKYDPRFYQICVDRAGAKKEETYIFEDADHAVRTAKKAGYHVCAIKDKSMESKEKEIKHYADLYQKDFTNIDALLKFLEN